MARRHALRAPRPKDLHLLPAAMAAGLIREGRLSSVDLVTAYLDRIAETDATLQAWAWLDRGQALAQAAELDRIRKAGRATGPLHGVPVGLKDIIDTRDMPTECGTPIMAGRRPGTDAALVERLREAGAVILGKTVTTELAFMHAAETRNPHNPAHSPGGSSSGSAAAVAALQVPLALGTQTNGSVIRPASFCGVYGFKPTRGTISRRGVLQTSASLDQIGVFANTLEDAALLADAIKGYDQCDKATFPRPRAQMQAGALADAPVEPNLLWLDLPYHDCLTADAREGFDELLAELGPRVDRMQGAPNLQALVGVQLTLHLYEICQHQGALFDSAPDRLSDTLKPMIAKGRAIGRDQYDEALEVKASAERFFDTLFLDYDAIIAPAATGEAPLFGTGTGDPVFCTIWTLCGLPAVTLPLMVGATGLPIGVQLIGAPERDDRLLRTARWLETTLRAEARE
jgi:Asp-tRNA(Asn)/Glu-tRNA(Gln) amidotransferase A subunit family amidase